MAGKKLHRLGETGKNVKKKSHVQSFNELS
jgi:hypothetical protein